MKHVWENARLLRGEMLQSSYCVNCRIQQTQSNLFEECIRGALNKDKQDHSIKTLEIVTMPTAEELANACRVLSRYLQANDDATIGVINCSGWLSLIGTAYKEHRNYTVTIELTGREIVSGTIQQGSSEVQ